MTLDEEYMTQALERARRAAELGEIPVGAIVVDPDGNIIGEAGTSGSICSRLRLTRRYWR